MQVRLGVPGGGVPVGSPPGGRRCPAAAVSLRILGKLGQSQTTAG